MEDGFTHFLPSDEASQNEAITFITSGINKETRHSNQMKNAIFLLIIIVLGFTSGCSTAQSMSAKKVLIVYLSRTNNTKAIAEIIQKHVGETLVALELQIR